MACLSFLDVACLDSFDKWLPEDRARSYLIRAVIYKSLNKDSESREYFEKCLAQENEANTKKAKLDGLFVYSHYFHSQLHLKHSRFEEAKKSLKKAEKYGEYDMYKVLSFRFQALNQQISKRIPK